MNSTVFDQRRKPLAPLAWRAIDLITAQRPPKKVHITFTPPTEQMAAFNGPDVFVACPGDNPVAYRWQWSQGLDFVLHVANERQTAIARVLRDFLTENAASSVQIVNAAPAYEDQEAMHV